MRHRPINQFSFWPSDPDTVFRAWIKSSKKWFQSKKNQSSGQWLAWLHLVTLSSFVIWCGLVPDYIRPTLDMKKEKNSGEGKWCMWHLWMEIPISVDVAIEQRIPRRIPRAIPHIFSGKSNGHPRVDVQMIQIHTYIERHYKFITSKYTSFRTS